MDKINFTKMVASGNDFVVVSLSGYLVVSWKKLARQICDRKFGIGADGLLVLEKSKLADVKMRIFNPDGSEAKMCGNGARCVALYIGKPKVRIETATGIIDSKVDKDNIKIKLTQAQNMKLDLPLKLGNRLMHVNFIDTGVPHTAIFVEGLDKIDVFGLGRYIRNHRSFKPAGTNVDFVEVLGDNSVKIRTYERGVEDETLACGTGAAACALIFAARCGLKRGGKINILTRSGEILKVYFNKTGNKFNDVWLEGKAEIVYKGVYYV